MALSLDVFEELRRAGRRWEYLPNNWIRVLCPFHDDSNPSCDVSVDQKNFKCHSCGAKGDFVKFLARLLKTERWMVISDLTRRYGDVNDKIVEPELIEQFHRQLWAAPPLLDQLRKRAVTDELIRLYRLGEDQGRITIPVKNAQGQYVNVMFYSPGAPGSKKFTGMTGRVKTPRIYPLEQLARYDEVMLCGGFIKAIVAAEHLNPLNIGAVTGSLGETEWHESLSEQFRGKGVVVCLDIDEPGRRATEERCAGLMPFVAWVRRASLPLDPIDYPKGDINDFVMLGGDLVQVYREATPWIAPVVKRAEEDPPDDSLRIDEAYRAEHSDKRVTVRAMVAAVDQNVYQLPSLVRVRCDRQQEQCGRCPIFSMEIEPSLHLPIEHPSMLDMIEEPTWKQGPHVQQALGIPECKAVKFDVCTRRDVEDVRLSAELSITSETPDNVYIPTVCIESPVTLNEVYNLTGRFMPHPKTQTATFVVSERKPAVDALRSFKLLEPERLEIFKPRDWSDEALDERLTDVWDDIESSVTRIYQRRSLHVALDMAYFSCLLIPYADHPTKGWVEILVVSDTSQGKSTATDRLRKYYGLGEMVDSNTATVAGLIGGVTQFPGSRKNFVKWGVFPTHDSRLVILDEIKDMPPDVFAKMTNMRSSGVADISKIERMRAHARTRLVALTNTQSGRNVGAYGYGVEAIRELFPGLEDVRRFDLCLVLSRDEVETQVLNSPQSLEPRTPRYPSELSRQLVLWAWTRRADQIRVSHSTSQALTEETLRLCDAYTDSMPLLDRGSARQKLARMATALACRTFSHSETTHDDLVVRECHVRWVSRFVDACYSTNAHGYRRYSEQDMSSREVRDVVRVVAEIGASPYARILAQGLLDNTEIAIDDVCDWCSWGREQALPFMSAMVRNKCLERDGRAYRKTASFTQLLREKLKNGAFREVPKHLENEPREREKF